MMVCWCEKGVATCWKILCELLLLF